MIKINLISILLLFVQVGSAQEEYENEIELMASNEVEQQINLLENTVHEKSRQFNINTVTIEELSSLFLLHPQEILAFMKHREKYGDFLSLLELQAIQHWDVPLIKKILPYVYIRLTNDKINVKHSITNGNHLLIYRTGRKNSGYVSKESWITQNRQLLNYKFKYKDQFQFGLLIEKDAGEKNLTDHQSMHVLIKNKGILKSLLVGDYIINMGQGLIHWQGYAFGRSSNILSGYRQGNFILPHTGTDENRFHRGLALQLKKGKVSLGLFVDRLKIDANVNADSLKNISWVSSLLLSGLHRTEGEKKDKNSLTKFTWGGQFKLNIQKGSIGVNFIQTNFSIPIQKRDQPYNKFSLAGKQWNNWSIDLALPTKLGFVFTEIALDQQLDHAITVGWLKSLDPKLDMSFIYRNMSAQYRAFESNCISRNGEAGNETGWLINVNFFAHAKHSIEGFVDIYHNHWPGYSSDRAELGSLFSLQYNWNPNKKTNFSTRYQVEKRTGNQGYDENYTSLIGENITHKWRTHISFMPIENITLRCRNEIIKVQEDWNSLSTGQLSYLEIIYKSLAEPLSLSFRYTFFSTDNYATRVYAYERDLSSFYSIPAHFDKGQRNYLLLQYNYKKAIKLQLKMIADQRRAKNNIIAFQQYPMKNKEWRMQVIWEIGN